MPLWRVCFCVGSSERASGADLCVCVRILAAAAGEKAEESGHGHPTRGGCACCSLCLFGAISKSPMQRASQQSDSQPVNPSPASRAVTSFLRTTADAIFGRHFSLELARSRREEGLLQRSRAAVIAARQRQKFIPLPPQPLYPESPRAASPCPHCMPHSISSSLHTHTALHLAILCMDFFRVGREHVHRRKQDCVEWTQPRCSLSSQAWRTVPTARHVGIHRARLWTTSPATVRRATDALVRGNARPFRRGSP